MTRESGSEVMPVAAEEVAQMAKVTEWEPLQLQNWIADIQRRTLLAARDVALADLNGYPGKLVPYTERLDGGASEACARRIAEKLELLAASLGEPGK